MTPTVHAVIESAQALSVIEQLEVIQALSTSLQSNYGRLNGGLPSSPANNLQLPAWVRRAAPVTDLSVFVAHFWPKDESADDVVALAREQRAADSQIAPKDLGA